MRGVPSLRLLGLAFFALMAACTASAGDGAQCVFDTDCEQPFVCAAGFCRPACATDADCNGGTCGTDPRSARRVCIPRGAPTLCRYASDCAANEICTRDGQCRPQCVNDYDCRVTNPFARCSPDRVCRVVCDEGAGNCDSDDRNGCEVDTRVEVSHCGACGTSCPEAPNARPTCAEGRCAIACTAPFADCDGDPANGCEADLSQPETCGACTNRCRSPRPLCAPSTSGSSGYACVEVCRAPAPDLCAGVCTDRTSDPRNCGTCDRVCPIGPGGTATCEAGSCAVRCEPGRGDCDGEAATGCEVTLASTAAHCGACGAPCPTGPNATATCNAMRCALVCEEGFANCDMDDRNGCEVDLRVDADHCGRCSTRCERPAGGTATCAAGRCGIACSVGFGDCDGNAGNGCETDTRGSVSHCGACGRACALANATAACDAGRCAIGRCNEGFADCDGDAANGCETDTRSSAANCGRCGNACPATNGAPTCQGGNCAIACAANFGDCDGNPANGCETDTRVNTLHCGACGTVCRFPNAGARCNASRCESTRVCDPATRGDCDGNAANGCETDLLSATANCGACGAACALPNATANCASGRCGIAGCNPGFADCDGNPANGCEVDTRSSASHCGRCGNACPASNGTPSCALGACRIACAPGFGDCDGNAANGCETGTASSVAHCGACGAACNLPNAVASCGAGRCAIAACNAGFGDCDGNPANGCEVDLRVSATHCGTCDASCSTVNGAASCAMGRCAIACATGFGNCDGSVANGCESNITSSLAHCGACGVTCSLANATAVCGAGRCNVGACAPGFGNCDGNAANGCETNTNNSATHCGACGRSCALPNATAVCTAGGCAVGACATGFADCDGDPANGCEIDLRVTPTHCGGCGRVCAVANGVAGCAASACTVASCNAGFNNCDGSAANGCETNLRTSNANCGACGTACASGTVCSAGACASVCGGGTTFCAGSCVDTAADATNCGRCANACPTRANAAAVCAGSTCTFRCNPGFGDCDGNAANGCEVDLRTTPANCGSCGNACGGTNGSPSCAAGVCGITCAAGFGNCDGNLANGCETDTRVTPSHCGACGTACSVANGTAGCAAGACTVANCNAGFGDCDGNAGNGCETGTAGSVTHCGRCGNVCSTTNGTASCTGGSCGIACAAGFGNCDGDASNGCEVRTSTDVNHCGACGVRCSLPNAVPACANGACTVASCATNWGDCDGNAANGCETNLLTSAAHCGRCGGACALANATSSCAAGACAVANCTAGFGNCDGNAANGCEVNTASSAVHCGGCGNACSVPNATAACSAGSCAVGTCNTGFGNCDGQATNGCETNLQTSTTHCGACGNACGTGFFCTAGTCTRDCGTLTNCANACIDTTTNPSHCGGCGAACPARTNASATCARSTCGFTCNNGFGNCDAIATNGCETNLNTTTAHCGGCGLACAPANATGACVAGVCGVGTCNAGRGNCDAVASNGCEVDTTTAVAHCGGCGNACSLPNATPGCRAGACVVSACLTGFGNCDGNDANGCEANLNTSPANCGACGAVCTFTNAAAVCNNGRCGLGTCNAGWGNCDGSSTNGCERDVTQDPANCGACGNLCPRVAGGVATCTNSVCGYACSAGRYDTGTGCALIQPPRLLFPMSTARVASQRPTLRWVAPTAPADGVRLQICRDPACATVVQQVDVTGTAFTVTNLLSAGPYFWRAYGRVGTNIGVLASPVWEFFVGARNVDRTSARGTVPDFNGDGIADVVVGAPGASQVFIYNGTLNGPATTPSRTLSGAIAGRRFGETVSSAGDLNGDGFGDLVITEPLSGQTHIHYGSSTGLGTTRTTLSVSGVTSFGSSASWAGDTDGDGYGDLIVGASSAQRAYVFAGTSGGIVTTAVRTYTSAIAAFGAHVRGLGAVNDDDLSDVAVAGTAGWSAFLGTSTTAATTVSLANLASLDGAGDVNGDGRADLVVATWLFRAGLPPAMVTYVHHGAATGLLTPAARTINETGSSSAAVVAGVEDVNNDGFSDIAISARGTVVRVFYGGTSGVGTTSVNIALSAFSQGAGLGGSGDVNGDRIDDMLIGYPDFTCEFLTSEWVNLYRGATGGLNLTPILIPSVNTNCNRFGESLALWFRPRAARCG